jgi:sugar phosphate isomerase/epimerase
MTGLSVSNIAWPAGHDAEALDLALAAGFTGVELAPSKTFGPWQAIDLAAVRAAAAGLAARGLPVVALQAILYGVQGAKLFGTPDEQAALRRHLGFVARMAGACGGVPCVFGAPGARDPGDLPEAEATDRAAACFAAIAPAFAAEGATLAFEANPAAYGCRFVTRTADALALVRRVAAPGFGLQIDAGTMLLNGEDAALLAEAAPLAVHCHASAPHLAPVAAFAAAHATLAEALRAAGWRGRVSVEMRATEGWRTALREAGAAMEAIWK